MASREPDFPPGPPLIPFLGNAHQLPKDTSSTYAQLHSWSLKYGEIYSLKLGGSKTVMVLSSPCAIREVLMRKAAISSNRPTNAMISSVAEGGHLVFARNCEPGRKLRRAANDLLSPKACEERLILHMAEAAQFANEILRDSDAFTTSVIRYSCSVVSSMIFDERVPTTDSPTIPAFQHYISQWPSFVEPGWLSSPEVMSLSKYLPASLTSWKSAADKLKSIQTSFWYGILTNGAESQGSTPCSLWKTVERSKKWDVELDQTVSFGGALFESGAEPIAAFLHHFTTLLALHPDVLRKCQEEMDIQVGSARSPTLEDIDAALPYLRAVVKEVLRFHPLKPFGIPHASNDELNYKGYRIPKSSTIFVNVWGILRDPELFDAPHVFNPDRYLASPLGTRPGLDESEYGILNTLVFGFGFRACPGQRLGQRAMNLAASKLVWGFDFGIASTSRGSASKFAKLDYSAVPLMGPTLTPLPFDISFEPRSVDHADVIQGDFKAAGAVLRAVDQKARQSDKGGPCTKWKLE